MIPRSLAVLAVSLAATSAFAAPAAPSAQATGEYHAALKALDDLVDEKDALMALSQQESADKQQAEAIITRMTESHQQLKAHLDNAAAAGHAVAFHLKARLLFAEKPLGSKDAVCALYGQAAALGLTAGALEYAKCALSYPPTDELNKRLALLETVVQGDDPYKADYPLPTTFPYCYPKHKPALQPGEDPIAWVQDNARPLNLSLEEFRAEGYYGLAMSSSEPNERRREWLTSAFAHGCREDSARVKNWLK